MLMATSGFFTYHDLYGGKPENYHHQSNSRLLSSTTTQVLSISSTTISSVPSTTISSFPNTTISSFSTTTNLVKLVPSTTIKSFSKLYKLVKLVPFAYFHWFLIGLAILLTLLLIIIFTCYCRSHCRKNKKSRNNEKKQPFPNFYRYRTANRRVHASNIDEPTAPVSYPSPTRPCPSKSTERLNNKLLRQGLDAVGSPQNPRMNVSQTGLSSTFTSTASDLITEIKSRLNTRSSESSLKNQRSYETQRANMALNDESKNGSLLIDMN